MHILLPMLVAQIFMIQEEYCLLWLLQMKTFFMLYMKMGLPIPVQARNKEADLFKLDMTIRK